MDFERQAYDALVAKGGRPSHPFPLITKVLGAPGAYRDILTFWQSRPDDWRVFTKQLYRWNAFRAFQLRTRPSHAFPGYAKLETDLTSRGFEVPPIFKTLAGGLNEDWRHKSKLGTWMDYLFFEICKRRGYEDSVSECEPEWCKAWAALVESGVLRPSEQRSESKDDVALKLCNQSNIELASQMHTRRRMEEDMLRPGGLRPTEAELQQMSPEDRRDLEPVSVWRKNVAIKEELEWMDRRFKQIAEFKKATKLYRRVRGDIERHEALLRWTLHQLPLIAEEEGRLSVVAVEEGQVPFGEEDQGRPSTPPPPIKANDLDRFPPPSPTTHFFDVLNYPRKPHLAQWWSANEFRVCASGEHDSGYRAVYALLAVCRESRTIVARHYKRIQQGLLDDPAAWQYPFPVFQNFNWIPADDLVVLRSPPKLQAPLPEEHAITFSAGPARNVGVCLPKEILLIPEFDPGSLTSTLDEGTQTIMIPEFLARLRRVSDTQLTTDQPPNGHAESSPTSGPAEKGGIKKIYLLFEGWHAEGVSNDDATPATGSKWLETCRRSRSMSWRFEAAKAFEPVRQCKDLGRLCDQVGDGLPRHWWWLGSGRDAVAGLKMSDTAEQGPALLVQTFKLRLRQVRIRGWKELEGVDVLGWIIGDRK